MKTLAAITLTAAAVLALASTEAGAIAPLQSPVRPRLLVIGNSLALHGAWPALGWDGNWGMAASSEQNDFSHILAGLMGADLEVRSIAPLEREAGSLPTWLPNAQANAGRTADVLVIKAGDNVVDPVAFESALGVYIDTVRGPARLVCVGTWYPKAFDVDAVIARVCTARGGRFVRIVDLFGDQRMHASSERVFASGVVGSHPGDAGMRAIAERVYAEMNARRYWLPAVCN